MKPSPKFTFLALLTFVSSILAVSSAGAAATSYYNNCGAASVVRPSSITEYCADAGAGVINIKWSSWMTTSAKGAGTFYINSCTPTCVSGKVYRTRANVVLSGLTNAHGKNYLMRVTVKPAGAKYFFWPKGKSAPTSVTWTTDLWRG